MGLNLWLISMVKISNSLRINKLLFPVIFRGHISDCNVLGSMILIRSKSVIGTNKTRNVANTFYEYNHEMIYSE